MNHSDRFIDYSIHLQGHLDQRWLRWFEGLQVSHLPQGETLIRGEMDQAALHGLLNRIRDLNMEIIAVQQMTSNEPNDLNDNTKGSAS